MVKIGTIGAAYLGALIDADGWIINFFLPKAQPGSRWSRRAGVAMQLESAEGVECIAAILRLTRAGNIRIWNPGGHSGKLLISWNLTGKQRVTELCQAIAPFSVKAQRFLANYAPP